VEAHEVGEATATVSIKVIPVIDVSALRALADALESLDFSKVNEIG